MTKEDPETIDDPVKVEQEEPKETWDDMLRTFIYAVLLAMVFRSLFYEPFHIPSSSMKDTLLVGDYIFVSKFSYGYSRYSFPFGLPIFEGRVWEDMPERGDVAVFRLPSHPRIDYIKRIVGLPGDKIQIVDGILHINGEAAKLSPLPDFVDRTEDGHLVNIKRFKETLPNGNEHHILDMTRLGHVDNTGVYTVPEAHYFAMGDNRDNSQDSRYLDEVGFIPAENLIGRAEIIFFSIEEGTRFWQVWKWFTSLRGGRFFEGID